MNQTILEFLEQLLSKEHLLRTEVKYFKVETFEGIHCSWGIQGKKTFLTYAVPRSTINCRYVGMFFPKTIRDFYRFVGKIRGEPTCLNRMVGYFLK